MHDKNDKSDSNKIDLMTYINKDKLNFIYDSFNRLGNSLNLDR